MPYISGDDDIDVLAPIAKILYVKLNRIPNVIDINVHRAEWWTH